MSAAAILVPMLLANYEARETRPDSRKRAPPADPPRKAPGSQFGGARAGVPAVMQVATRSVPKFALFGMPATAANPAPTSPATVCLKAPRLLREEAPSPSPGPLIISLVSDDEQAERSHESTDDEQSSESSDEDEQQPEAEDSGDEDDDDSDATVSDVEEEEAECAPAPIVPGTEAAFPAADEVVAPEPRVWQLAIKEEVRAKRATDTLRTSGAIPADHRYVHVTRILVRRPPTTSPLAVAADDDDGDSARRPAKLCKLHHNPSATLPIGLPPRRAAKSRQTRPFDLVLCYQLGQYPEQRIARLSPSQEVWEMALDVHLPILIDDIATPLRFWLRRRPDDMFDTPAVASPFEADVHGFTVRQSPLEAERLAAERAEASARLALRLAEADAAMQRAHQRDLAQLWVARYADEENRPNRKQLAPWLVATDASADASASHRLSRLLQCVADNRDEFLLVLDSSWLANGRAHAQSDMAFLHDTLFRPYTEAGRVALQQHGLMCRVRTQDSHSIFHLSPIPPNDSSLATGLPVALFQLLQAESDAAAPSLQRGDEEMEG